MSESSARTHKGPLAWMASNTVAANLLMIVLLVGGALLASNLKQEVFPEIELNVVTITVPYPGASTTEVEEGIVLAIEEAVRGLDGVKEVRSVAAEDLATVTVELFTDTDRSRALNDVKNAVDRITSLPLDAEEPTIALPEARTQVLSLLVYGDMSRTQLHDAAERVRRELLGDERITLVERSGLPPPEIAVEISQERLRSLGLTIAEVARRIRAASVDLAAGSLETQTGEVLLRVTEQRETAQGFRRIIIASDPGGSTVRLGDIATVRESFRESADDEAWYAGHPAIRLNVFSVGNETPTSVSNAVHEYVSESHGRLAGDVNMTIVEDFAEVYSDRVGLLLRNGALGAVLVLIILGVFLHPRLAFWVTLGIPVSFLGAFLFIPAFDVSINMISLFAFLLVLGIVVDDAIVVGEATFRARREGAAPLDAAINGTREMLQPVIFAVLTTAIAFVPMLFVPGVSGEFFWPIPVIVITILAVSLLESLAILPAHLAHVPQGIEQRDTRRFGWFTRRQRAFSQRFEAMVEEYYRPTIRRLIEFRYLTLAGAVALLTLAVSMVTSGILPFAFMPRIEGDVVSVSLELPFGAPIEETRRTVEQITAAGRTAAEHLSDSAEGTSRDSSPEEGTDIGPVKGIYAQIGASSIAGPGDSAAPERGAHLALIQSFLRPMGERDVSAERFADRWRAELNELPGVERLAFSWDAGPPAGAAIAIELSHHDQDVLRRAAAELADALAAYDGVRDVDDGFAYGKPQLDIELKPAARALGITSEDLAQQLRNAYFGAEATRQQRGRFELRTYVRREPSEQTSQYFLDNMIIRTPQGGEIPLEQAASLQRTRSATRIERTDGQRTVVVSADVNQARTSAGEVISQVEQDVLPDLTSKYPGLVHGSAGEREAQTEAFSSLGRGMSIALLVMYAVLAVAFRSYAQPLLVMLAIPFGFIGAVVGHLLLGFQLSLISILGLVALAGVVVNDSLVLVTAINDARARGQSTAEAVEKGCMRRFRPVILTSLTTFFGLAPMIFEQSLQARFLIPMSLSLGFGVLFVTVIVLAIVPVTYMIGVDLRRSVSRGRAALTEQAS